MLISPSIFAADMTNLKDVVKKLEKVKVDMLHIDIMDGHFVPNISFGSRMVKLLRPLTPMPFDVHLMISDPLKYLDSFVKAGADYCTFHIEAVSDVERVIKEIKDHNIKVGISLKPKTPVEAILPFLKDLDLVLVMSVEPGFSGQTFMPEVLPKIKALSNLKKEKGYHYLIEVDGGVNNENIKDLRLVGCDMVVVGTFLFNQSDFKKTLESLKTK